MEVKQFYPEDLKEWRKWLEKNHLKENKIAVIRYKKHTGKNSPSHLELMHEAICFGWIDTTIKRLDDEKYLINFSKRNEKSRWSENTLSYAKNLIKEGKMVEHGMIHYKAGLKKPTLDSEVSKNPETPEDLKEELKKIKLQEKFENFPKSYKRMYLRWIERAKMKETKKKRRREVVEGVRENKKGWGVGGVK